MEILENEKKFRYLSGVIKYISEFRKNTKEEDIVEFEIKFNGCYYILNYKFRW
jgi:hypothetical protein